MAGRYRAPRTWIAIFGVSECMLQTQCVWNNQHCWAVLIRSDDNNRSLWKHISPNSRTLQTQLASSHRPCKGNHLMCSVSVSTFEQAQQTFSSPSPHYPASRWAGECEMWAFFQWAAEFFSLKAIVCLTFTRVPRSTLLQWEWTVHNGSCSLFFILKV